MTLRRPLPAVVLALVAACGPDRAEVKRIVDQRLAEREAAAASASASPPSAPSAAERSTEPSDPRIAASFDLLRRLDEVMKGYEPVLPEMPGDDDLLRCVTTLAGTTRSELKGITARRAADRARAKRERDRAQREFRDVVRPLAFRIDHAWKTRGGKAAAQYGCWMVRSNPYHGGTIRFWVEHVQGSVPKTAADCSRAAAITEANGYTVDVHEWKVRVPEGAFTYTYSRATEPPTDPPELMRRIAAAKLVVPERFACRVADAVAAGAYSVVLCDGERSEEAPAIRLSGDAVAVNVGDVVSVPLAGAERDPDGVLLKWRVPGHGKAERWTVDAAASALKIESAASCPTVEQIVASSAQDGGDGGG